MTDEVQVDDVQNQDNSYIADVAQPAEKMVAQSEVNKIAANVRQDAYAKARRDAEQEFMAKQGSMGGTPQFSQEQLAEVKRIYKEEAMQEYHMAMGQKIASELQVKVDRAKAKYPDFEEAVRPLELWEHPDLMAMLNGVDNSEDVIYEMAQNERKFVDLVALSHKPALAQRAIQKMSASIKQNEQAKNTSTPNVKEPLSQLKQSSSGLDNGEWTVKDFKKRYRG